MTDGQQNLPMQTYERQEQIRQWKANAAQRKADGVDIRFEARGELELARAQQEAAEAKALETQPLPEASASPPVSAEDAMRHVRLAVTAVIVLVLFALWIRQRRRG